MKFFGRVLVKHDTVNNWNQVPNFIPLDGEVIVYDDYSSIEEDGKITCIPAVKIGNGVSTLPNLAFIDEEIKRQLFEHINNFNLHISEEERMFWNNKVSCYMDTELKECIVFDSNGYVKDGVYCIGGKN